MTSHPKQWGKRKQNGNAKTEAGTTSSLVWGRWDDHTVVYRAYQQPAEYRWLFGWDRASGANHTIEYYSTLNFRGVY